MPSTARAPLDGLLLAEAVRLQEEGQGRPLDEAAAEQRARAVDGHLEQRIVARAEALSVAPALEEALRHVRGGCILVLAGGIVLAAAAGGGVAQALLGSTADAKVNFFRLLAGLLALPTLTLAAWVVLVAVRPGAGGVPAVGRTVVAAGAWVTRRLHAGPPALAAARAVTSVLAGSAVGRWVASAITHALWLSYLASLLAVVVFHLGTREFTFTWETTILSDSSYVAMTRAIATVPGLLGFATPRPDDVAVSRRTAEPAAGEARRAWAGLLIGSIVVYGLLPRLVCLVLSLVAARRAARTYRLDMSHPGFARLRLRLDPWARPVGVVDADTAAGAPSSADGLRPAVTPAVGSDGPVAAAGLEIDRPASGWPPAAAGIDWLDLGLIDDRSGRHQVIEQIRQAVVRPRAALLVCALPQTPDRGHGAFIDDLQRQTGVAVLIVLSAGQRLRARGDGDALDRRIEDWRALTAAAGVPEDRVMEVDLDHLTPASRERLARWLGGAGAAVTATPSIRPAFALIVEHAERWRGRPGLDEQSELQRAIARLFGAEASRWRDRLGLTAADRLPGPEQLRSAADTMLGLLPERLRAHGRWLSVGALAGALGCVAAATLVAPAAIAALPAWAGLGAAASAVLRGLRAPASSEDEETADTDVSDAVAAAAMFALVLVLQGRDEAAITRTLDRVLADSSPPAMDGAAAAEAWLETVAQRLDRVMAEPEPLAP
jgi:hypothetical protein